VKSLGQRAARCQAQLHRLLCGESVADPMMLAQEISSIRQGIALLRLSDDRERTLASRSAPPAETAVHPVQ
jgi:hypothetical protein